MTRRPRWNHTTAFKAKVAIAAIKGDRTLAQLEGSAADVFGSGCGTTPQAPTVDVTALHAKIGKLTLENDFLEAALTKAGLLSARR